MRTLEEILERGESLMEEQSIPSKIYVYPSRVACSVLDEMRKLIENTNCYSYDRVMMVLPSMVEELQTHFNRMEAALEDQDSLRTAHDKLKEIKELHNSLREECIKIKEEINELSNGSS